MRLTDLTGTVRSVGGTPAFELTSHRHHVFGFCPVVTPFKNPSTVPK